MTSLSFKLMATVTASTTRAPSISGGKRGVAVENLSTLKCTPLDPVDADIREQFATATPMELRQTFCQGGLDIIEGDVLVVSSASYRIRAAGEWKWEFDSTDYLHLILEEIKTT